MSLFAFLLPSATYAHSQFDSLSPHGWDWDSLAALPIEKSSTLVAPTLTATSTQRPSPAGLQWSHRPPTVARV